MVKLLNAYSALIISLGIKSIQAQDESDAHKTYNLTAPDDSIRASFIAQGATITHLYVKDNEDSWRDIILGYDYENTTQYETDPAHPFFGALVGRYANRIKNSTFSIPPTNISEEEQGGGADAQIYHVTPNENDGQDTLHGGTPGYDRRHFNVEDVQDDSITFTLEDADGEQGFPGRLVTTATYKLENGGTWKISYKAKADAQTPVMFSSHTYFNLDAYRGNSTFTDYNSSKALDHHHLEMNAKAIVDTDSILIPTGEISTVQEKPAYDFSTESIVSARFDQTLGGCGADCTGYDNCFIFEGETDDDDHFDKRDDEEDDDDDDNDDHKVTVWSDVSGIKLELTSNQVAIQIYTCVGVNKPEKGSITRKSTQKGDDSDVYENYSCIVLEPESWIDGINNPSWPVDQIYGPDRDYEFTATYKFSTIGKE